LLAPRLIPKLEDHPLLAFRDCLFNIFEAALHIGGRSSFRNLTTRHAVVTGTHLSGGSCNTFTRNPKHAVPRQSASCKSVGSTRTDLTNCTFAPLQQTHPSPVTQQSPLVRSVACISCHLFIGTVSQGKDGTSSRHARRIQFLCL